MFWLLLLSAVTGAVMIGAMCYALAFRRVYYDKNTAKTITEIKIPIFGKIKSSTPTVIVCFLGVFLVWLAIHESHDLPKIREIVMKGDLESTRFPVFVYAVVRVEAIHNNRPYSVQVPTVPTDDGRYSSYKLVYVVGNVLLDEEEFDIRTIRNGEIAIQSKKLAISNVVYESGS